MKVLNMTAFALALLVSTSAFAQSSDRVAAPINGECVVDADCGEGQVCIINSSTVCTDCAQDTPDCGGCYTDDYASCEAAPPAQCGSDADCAGDDVCVSFAFESCSAGGATDTAAPCLEGEDCGASFVAEEPCTTEVEAYCVPPYIAPCQVDLDCGAGFTCETAEVCSCSGGAPQTDPAEPVDPDGGTDMGVSEDPMPEEPECFCEPAGEAHCQIIEVECVSDADCDGDFECLSDYNDAPVVRPTIDCGPDEDCAIEPAPMPEPGPSYCVPSDYLEWGGDEGTSKGVAELTGQNAEVTSTDRVNWGASDGGTKSSTEGGCSATGTQDASGAAGLLSLLFGFFAFRRRREE